MIFHFDKVEDFAGFAVGNANPGELVRVLARTCITSDDQNFYHYCEEISNMFLNRANIIVDSVHQFLVVIHQDLSGDLFVNDFSVAVEIKAKRDIKQGDVVTQTDIADIRKVKFPEITITETDKVIYCFKVGWRFGLFFDLAPRVKASNSPATITPEKLDLEMMMFSIGDLYRYLRFYHVYKVLESEAHFKEMMMDGWFPFIQIFSDEYKTLSEAYKSKFDLENKILKVVDSFDKNKIKAITEKWWGNKIFADKKSLIEAGISAYLQNTPDGFVNCIKNLLTEVEGILRSLYLAETGKGERVNSNDLISYIIQKAKDKSSSDHSLLLPEPFLKYLHDVVFADFNLETGKVNLSRNSSSHGVARPEQYTKARAVQLILILDQIYFYS